MAEKEIPEPVQNAQMQSTVHTPRHNVAKEALIGAGIGAAALGITAPMNAASPRGFWGGILAFDIVTMNPVGAILSSIFLAQDRNTPNQKLNKSEVRELVFHGALTGAVIGAVFGAGQAMWRNHKEKPAKSHTEKVQQSIAQADSVSR